MTFENNLINKAYIARIFVKTRKQKHLVNYSHETAVIFEVFSL